MDFLSLKFFKVGMSQCSFDFSKDLVGFLSVPFLANTGVPDVLAISG